MKKFSKLGSKFKKRNLQISFVKQFFSPSCNVVKWNQKYYWVDFKNKEVKEIEKPAQGRFVYLAELESFFQDFVKVPEIISDRQLPKVIKHQFLKEKEIDLSNYYFFCQKIRLLREGVTEEKEWEVSVVYFEKEEIKKLFSQEEGSQEIVPVEFCIAGYSSFYSSQNDTLLTFFVDKENSRFFSILCIKNFPVEVIKDSLVEEIPSALSRSFFYFQGKYSELNLNRVLVVGNLEDFEIEQIKASLPVETIIENRIEKIFLGIKKSLVKLRNPVFFIESLAQAGRKALVIILSVLLIKSSVLTAQNFGKLKTNLQNIKNLEKKLTRKRAELKKLLKDKKIRALIYEIKPYLGISGSSGFFTVDYALIFEFLKAIKDVKKELGEDVKFQTFEVKPGKEGYVIRLRGEVYGNYRAEIRKKAYRLIQTFEKLGEIRFLRTPVNPPSTPFEVKRVVKEAPEG